MDLPSRGELSKYQLKVIFDTLCNGEQEAALPLVYMQQFKDCIEMYFWLRRNGVQGKKLVELFKEKGRLGAITYIRDRAMGRRYTSERLKGDALS